MRPVLVGELAETVRKACLRGGFSLTDKAEDAIRGSELLPESGSEITILAKLAGVPRTTVLTWVIHQRQRAAAIQAERLELLGHPAAFAVYVNASGVVCSREEVSCAN